MESNVNYAALVERAERAVQAIKDPELRSVAFGKILDGFLSMDGFQEVLSEYIGQKMAVICARYHYRGILSKVNKECLILANATAVETSGQSNRDAPEVEDIIGSSIIIKNDAIELFYQPNWCFAPLPGEESKSQKATPR